MAKHKIDFDDYEEWSGSGYDGEEPKKGIYDGKLISVKDHTSANDNEGLEWVFEIEGGDYDGWRGWVYSNFDTALWKTQQIVKAINGGQEKAFTVDTDSNGAKTVKKAKGVRLRIANETYEGEKKGRIRSVLPVTETKSRDDDDDFDSDDDDPFAEDND